LDSISAAPVGGGALVARRLRGGLRLDHDQADGVGDDIVQLARDPRPLVGHRDPRPGLAARSRDRPLLEHVSSLPAGAHGAPGDPRPDHEHARERVVRWLLARTG
jgi:hypothetical protein